MTSSQTIAALWLTLAVGCGAESVEEAVEPVATEVGTPELEAAASALQQELAALDGSIAFHRERFESRRSWGEAEQVGRLLQQRFRLSQEVSDLEAAHAVLTEAFEVAPECSGPHLAHARVLVTLHRLDEAEARLAQLEARAVLLPADRQGLAEVRAELALQRGELDLAEAYWLGREEAAPSLESAARLALVALERREHAQAHTWLETAASRHQGRSAEPLAWLYVQHAEVELDRADVDAALSWLERAEETLPGFPLVQSRRRHALALRDGTELLARPEEVGPRSSLRELMPPSTPEDRTP